MDIKYIKKSCLEQDNDNIIAEIKSVLNTCSPLNIYCAVEHDVWGIWIEVDRVKYLVNPIELINSLFEDNIYYMLEVYPFPETGKSIIVNVYKDYECYSWRITRGISNVPRPIYISYDEYVSKIKACMEALYASLIADKPTAYDERDFDRETLGIAVEQMKISAVMPSYYRLMASSVKEEPFVFNIEQNDFNETYTIGIGNRKYTTWLTHWDNNYDTIRYQFESYVHNRESTINLSFDMSDLVLKIKHVSVLDKINESEVGYGFEYKDYALIEIIPNEFIHGPILKGYCDAKQVIRTFYEGLFSLAIAHYREPRDDYEPSQIEAYNMFKSPLIEKYISGIQDSPTIAEVRQVRVKRILRIIPDYSGTIMDSEGTPVEIDTEDGNIDGLYDKEGRPFMVDGLKEWQEEIIPVVTTGAVGHVMESFDWKSYHERGLALAQTLKSKLSSDFDLWYEAPVEDNSGCVPKPIFIYEQLDMT